MKLLLDFLPIVIFVAVYKYTSDIIMATAALIPATILSVGYTWFKEKKIEKMQIVTLVLVITMGGATVIFQDKTFIQWKPSVINWLFAATFLGSHFIGEKTIIERIMGAQMVLEKKIWITLSIAWVAFFCFMGIINLYVAFNYSEATWVNFKLFGMLGLTVVFIIIQGIYISLNSEAEEELPPNNK
ncbi:MAG: septation protein A [Oceanospirillaceae bacterium]|nr:septation protein A [Oceanospirillaceae bacterium]